MQNFFSTDFVAAERRDNGSLMLVVSGNWWIALAAAVPLTITTVNIWWMYVRLKIDELPIAEAFFGSRARRTLKYWQE